MSFELRGEAVVGAHGLEELKLVYRVLHDQLTERPELMDTHFLMELQNFLHERCRAAGVDPTDHGAWDRWLGYTEGRVCRRNAGPRR